MHTGLDWFRRHAATIKLFLFLFVCLILPSALQAQSEDSPASILTTVTGVIGVDTTWTLAQSPYRVAANDSVVVANGVVLTIEPGVVVEFEQSAHLQIQGTLRANGTAAQQIVFTGVTKTPGFWDGLIVWGTTPDRRAVADLTHTIIEYGGIETGPTPSGVSNLEIGNADVTANNLISRNSSGDGLLAHQNSSLNLAEASFEGNAGAALRLRSYMTKPVLSQLSATGNGVDATVIGGDTGIYGDDLWEFTGIPYVIAHVFNVYEDAVLRIEPGVELVVSGGHAIIVRGVLLADGTAEQPILFTSVDKSPGSWQGIQLQGDAQNPPFLRLSHATVEYGGLSAGNGANIRVNMGSFSIHDSIIRYSAGHGVYFFGNPSGSVIASSHIVNNNGYGILSSHAATGHILLAANNWWGSPSGPAVDDACNPGGQGSRLSAGVVFKPFLTSTGAETPAIEIADAYLIMLEPQRWFAPANGVTPVYVDVTVVDGAGKPVPGQVVRLRASIGAVVDGGITDITGRTRAILRSSTAGDAEIFAELSNQSGCAYARSGVSHVTFTATDLNSELLADARAPYLNDAIEITPMPVTRGVPTTLRATIQNPNGYPIVVEASFGFAQAGIGLAFDPLGAPQTKTIAAHSSVTFETQWTPTVAGHYCVEVVYTIVGGGNSRMAESGGRGQRNLNVYGGAMITPSGKNSIRQGQVATTGVDDANFAIGAITNIFSVPVALLQGQLSGNILDFIFEGGGGIDCAMKGGTSCSGWKGPRMKLPGDTIGNLAQDPPSQDYRTILTVEPLTAPPIESGPDMSPALAAALNDLVAAAMDAYVDLFLAAATYDRYAGAVEAGSLQWSSIQSANYLIHLERSAHGLIAVADSFDALFLVLEDEEINDVFITAADFAAYQQRLNADGYSPAELQAAWLVGLDDEALEQRRQAILAQDPDAVAGSVLDNWQALAKHYRKVGLALLQTPGIGTSSLAGLSPAGSGALPTHDLVRLYDTEAEIIIANPLAETTTIDLRARMVNLPPEWRVDISPQQVTLEPGAQATVRVTVRASTAAVQGTAPLLAVEGYAGNQLLGGVGVQINAPRPQTPHVFLPYTVR